MKFINDKYYGLFNEIELVPDPKDLDIFNCIDTGFQYRFFNGKWYKQPIYWTIKDNVSGGGGEGGGGGSSDLPEVTDADNGDVLTVVDGAWDKAAPQGGESICDITRDRYYLVENEEIELEVDERGDPKYYFTGLQRQTDLLVPGADDSVECYIRVPDKFVQGLEDAKVKITFIFSSDPAPSSTSAFAEWMADLDGEKRLSLYAGASFEEQGKMPMSVDVAYGESLHYAHYADDSLGITDPDDYGWYFHAYRTGKVMGSDETHDEYKASLPDSAFITIYLEMVDVEFDPDFKEAVTREVQNTLNPDIVIYYDPYAYVPAWRYDGADPFKLTSAYRPEATSVYGATVPARLDPVEYYHEYGDYDDPYAVATIPLPGRLYVNFELDEYGQPTGRVIDVGGQFAVFVWETDWGNNTIKSASLKFFDANQTTEFDYETEDWILGDLEVLEMVSIDLTDLATLGDYLFPPFTGDPG